MLNIQVKKKKKVYHTEGKKERINKSVKNLNSGVTPVGLVECRPTLVILFHGHGNRVFTKSSKVKSIKKP